MRPKLILRQALSFAFYHSQIPLILTKGKIIILMYHRVLDGKDELNIQPGMYVTSHVFEEQIKFLISSFKIISFYELLQRLKNATIEHNSRYCIITFDDGWRDNFINAYPILKKYNIPATIFLPSSYIDTTNWFWPERLTFLLTHMTLSKLSEITKKDIFEITEQHGINHARKKLNQISNSPGTDNSVLDAIIENLKTRPESQIESLIGRLQEILGMDFPQQRILLSWQEIDEMSRNGITFGSHTVSHRILTKLSIKEKEAELVKSFEALKDAKINFIPIFSYPNGDYDQQTIDIVKRCGYRGAVTTQYGSNNSHTDPFLLKRIGIHQDISSTKSLFSFRITNTCIPMNFLRM